MRKKLLSLFAGLLISAGAFAQPANDDCSTAQNIGTLPTPATCPNGTGAAININGTLVGATPMNPYTYMPNCSGAATETANPANDVWYTFTASGYQAVITINSTFSDPNIAMYSGTCGALGGGVGGCAVGAGGTVTLTVEQMVIGTTYMIQVSSTSTGTFTMNIQNNIDCNACMSSATLTANPLPVNGAYQPGQTVNFCFKINNYAEVNTNWMHGVQLGLGAGWNLGSIVASPATSWGNDGTWNYYPGGTIDGQGNAWPQGWYFDRNTAPLGGGTAGDGNPGNNFGDEIENGTGVVPAGVWQFCFSVQVASACNPGSDLSVTFNTSGDGESGTWTNLACIGDPPTVSNAIGSCCPPTMSSTPASCTNNDGTATATPVGSSGPYTYSWSGPSGYSNTSNNVAGANTISNVPAGNYTVTITDATLCAVTATVAVGGNPVVPAAPTTTPISYCLNATPVPLTATPTAGGTLNWYGTNAAGGTASGTAPTPGTTTTGTTTYYVSQTLSGCEGPRAPLAVTINPLPTPVVNSNSPVCEGAAINLTASGGTTYAWTGPNAYASGTQNPTIAAATPVMSGTYSVTVTDANNCQAQGTTSVTVNPLPVLSAVPSQTVCANVQTTAITFTSTVTGTTINWTNSDGTIGVGTSGTGNIAAFAGTNAGTAPVAGNFSATPTANGCAGAPITFTITVNPIPVLSPVTSQTVCAGVQTTAITYNSTVAGTTVNWTNTDGTIGVGTTGTGNIAAFAGINTGSTSVSGNFVATPTANTCPGSAITFTITVNPIPVLSTVTSQTICAGVQTTAINFNSTVTGTTVNWTNSDGTIGVGTSGTGNIAAFNGINAGAAPVSGNFVATPTANTCIGNPVNFTITVNPVPVLSPVPSETVCAGAQTTAINFNSTAGGTSVDWTNTNGTIGISLSGNGNIASFTGINAGTTSAAGNFVATPTANNCTGTPVNFTITVNPIPVIDAITNQTLCAGDQSASIAFNPTVTGTTVNWTNSDGTIGVGTSGTGDIASFTGTNAGTTSAAGNFVATPTANGCTGTPVNFTITVNPLPVAVANSIPVPTYCVNESFTLQASPNGMATYQWTGPLSFSSNQQNPTATLISVPMSGTYSLTVIDANGCQNQATTSIVVNPLPLTTIGSNGPVCVGNTLNLSATGGANYSWQGPNGYTSSTQNPSITNVSLNNAGNYSVIVTDANGCSSPNFTTVVINANPLPAASASPACLGTDLELGVTPSFAAYSWSGPNGFVSALQNPVVAGVTNAAQGTYTVNVTDANGCTGSNTVTTTVYPLPTATTNTITSGCAPVCRDFFVSGNNLINFTWDLGNGNFSGNDTLTGHCYYDPGSYTVSVTITDINGCVNTVNFPAFSVYEVPQAEFTYGPKEITILEPLINFADQSIGTNIISWDWQFGDQLNTGSADQNPSFTYPEVGYYNVQLIVENDRGCIDTVMHTLYVPEDWAIYVPTAFSPNDDGVNDYFYPKGVGIDEDHFQMWIFDRWGNQLFYTKDWNSSWDGKVQGHSNMVQEDVYIWKIIAQSFKGDKFNEVGHVTVVK